jgi:O-antigen/teichoic acid export membrane protein
VSGLTDAWGERPVVKSLTATIMRVTRAQSARVVSLTGAAALLASIFAVLSARWLGPSDRGAIVLVSTIGSFLMIIGSFGTAIGGRTLLSRNDARLSLHQSYRIAVGFAIANLGVAAVLGSALLSVTGGWRGPWVGAAFAIYASSLVGVFVLRESLHGTGHHVLAGGSDTVVGLLLVTGVIALAAVKRLDMVTTVALMAAAMTIQFCLLMVAVRRLTRTREHAVTPIRIPALVQLSLPLLLTSVAQALVIRGDRVLLGKMSDTASVGIYGTAATFTEATWLISLALSQVAFRASGQSSYERVRSLRRKCLLGTLLVATVTAILSKPAVSVLLGDAYSAAIPLIWLLLGAAGFMAVFLFESAVLNGSGHARKPALAASVGCLILVVGCVGLIPELGSAGAALATNAAYAVMAGLTVRWSWSISRARA